MPVEFEQAKTERQLMLLLEAKREFEGISLRQFATNIGVSPAMYSLWLQRKRKIGKRVLMRVRDIYPELVSDELVDASR